MDAGCRVITQASADHALAVLTMRSDADILLTDIDRPGSLTSSALARIIDRRWPAMAIVATSGIGKPAPGELLATTWFLQKPYPPSVLVEAVKAALSSIEMRRMNVTSFCSGRAKLVSISRQKAAAEYRRQAQQVQEVAAWMSLNEIRQQPT